MPSLSYAPHRNPPDLSPDAIAPTGILLHCPRCGGELSRLACTRCAFEMEVRDGIVCALPPERAVHYKQFLIDYQRIRSAEGRGCENSSFYLALPWQDLNSRNARQWQIRSRSYSYLAQHLLGSLPPGASILDLGAGNCWMSYRLALLGFRTVAVDLLTNEHDGLGAAVHFDPHLPSPIPRFQAEATHLPFGDHQFDAVVFNASFHYSENYEATLREALRCTTPTGIVVISDTPWYASDESGNEMVAERQVAFCSRFQTASSSINSLEYLTDARLQQLADAVSITWTTHRPWYGIRWALRPAIAKLRGRREPSRFRIYVASRHA